ncbi:MAG: hypothetical protein S4CHLAM81_07170 [Chlamydiales bacterium]|nr:hypothetical protein [Chlamydiales bacterium]MCH9635501.1 hypothetical protein [Chlamydiales bacterium]
MRSYSGGSAWTRAVFDKRLENWGSGYSILHEGRLIGHLELVPGSGMTEVAMMVDQAFQGRGFAKEVLNAVLSKIKNPVGYIDRQNAKAHKLASSCGFKEENGVYKKCSGSHC